MVRVMVVEDEPGIREFLAEVLADEGFETVEAATADDAVPLLEDDRVRVLLTDINLPGNLDGIGLARVARNRSPRIPVVFIQKPFSVAGLVANVQRLAATTSMPMESRGRTGVRDVRRIAVVAGESWSRDFATEARVSLGAQVYCAANGTDGVTLLASRAFDLALVEAGLSGRSSFSVAAAAATANTPTLMISGHPDAARACEVFGFPYLSKPFGTEALRREAAKIMEQHDAALRRTKEAVAKMHAETERLRDEVATSAGLVYRRPDCGARGFAATGGQ